MQPLHLPAGLLCQVGDQQFAARQVHEVANTAVEVLHRVGTTEIGVLSACEKLANRLLDENLVVGVEGLHGVEEVATKPATLVQLTSLPVRVDQLHHGLVGDHTDGNLEADPASAEERDEVLAHRRGTVKTARLVERMGATNNKSSEAKRKAWRTRTKFEMKSMDSKRRTWSMTQSLAACIGKNGIDLSVRHEQDVSPGLLVSLGGELQYRLWSELGVLAIEKNVDPNCIVKLACRAEPVVNVAEGGRPPV